MIDIFELELSQVTDKITSLLTALNKWLGEGSKLDYVGEASDGNTLINFSISKKWNSGTYILQLFINQSLDLIELKILGDYLEYIDVKKLDKTNWKSQMWMTDLTEAINNGKLGRSIHEYINIVNGKSSYFDYLWKMQFINHMKSKYGVKLIEREYEPFIFNVDFGSDLDVSDHQVTYDMKKLKSMDPESFTVTFINKVPIIDQAFNKKTLDRYMGAINKLPMSLIGISNYWSYDSSGRHPIKITMVLKSLSNIYIMYGERDYRKLLKQLNGQSK